MLDGQTPLGQELSKGRFVITGVLGTGAQALTFEAVDKLEGTPVAIKCFRLKHAQSWKDVELAEREASVLAGLTHPLLPRYVAHFEENGNLYLAMERVEGKTLQALRAERVLDQSDVVALLRDLSQILTYLHGRSPPIIHRDIKPRNIIRRPDGRFVLVDFGSVRDCLKPEGGSTVVGTFGFMAPEQFQGRAMPASDVYAAGATALSVLAGREPEQLPHKGLALDVPRALNGNTTPQLEALLSAALEPDPDKRARRSLAALLQDHDLDSDRAATRPSSTPKQTQKTRARFEQAVRDPLRRARQFERIAQRESREAGREIREVARHTKAEFKARRKADKAARKARRKGRSLESYPFRSPGPRIPSVVLLGLFVLFLVLRVALSVGLRVVLPAVLRVLSSVFGKRLRYAAQSLQQAGLDAQAEIQAAQARLLGRSPRQQLHSEQVRPAEDANWRDPRSRISTEQRLEHFEEKIEAAVEEWERSLFRR